MKTIIAGSRGIAKYEDVAFAIADCQRLGYGILHTETWITELVCGCCEGPDVLGFRWARKSNIPVRFFPAWHGQHKWAEANAPPGEVIEPMPTNQRFKERGPIRNYRMAEYADALIAIWDGQSRGTKNMIRTAERLGLRVFIHNPKAEV